MSKGVLMEDSCWIWKIAPLSSIVYKDIDVEEGSAALPIDNQNHFSSADGIDEDDFHRKDITLPTSIRLTLFLFCFFYVGLESGFGGWISSYASHNTHIIEDTTDVSGTSNAAAFLSTVFFLSMSIGRILSIPLAVRYAPSVLMKAHLGITVVGGLLMIVIGRGAYGYVGCAVGTAVIGLGISAIFPIGLTFAHEYQLPM
jgi:fucose permease